MMILNERTELYFQSDFSDINITAIEKVIFCIKNIRAFPLMITLIKFNYLMLTHLNSGLCWNDFGVHSPR
jgi:hypothetical protein